MKHAYHPTRPLVHLLCFFESFVDRTDEKECGFGQVVVLTVKNLAEASDGLLDGYVSTLHTGKLLRNGKGLGFFRCRTNIHRLYIRRGAHPRGAKEETDRGQNQKILLPESS